MLDRVDISIAAGLIFLIAGAAFMVGWAARRDLAVGGKAAILVLCALYLLPSLFGSDFGPDLRVQSRGYFQATKGLTVVVFALLGWYVLKQSWGAFLGIALGMAFVVFVIPWIQIPGWLGIVFWLAVTIFVVRVPAGVLDPQARKQHAEKGDVPGKGDGGN